MATIAWTLPLGTQTKVHIEGLGHTLCGVEIPLYNKTWSINAEVTCKRCLAIQRKQELERMSGYLVTLKILVDGYEKDTDVLIKADSEKEAYQYALSRECHNPDSAHWEDCSTLIDDGFIYSLKKCQKLSKQTFKAISAVKEFYVYDFNQLNYCGDY